MLKRDAALAAATRRCRMAGKAPGGRDIRCDSRPARSPTVFDVAREVGCSIATVLRAINEPGRVSASIRQRVLEVVKRLGYVPNGSARALRSAKFRLMGAVIPTISHAIYTRLIESVQGRLSARGGSRRVIAPCRCGLRPQARSAPYPRAPRARGGRRGAGPRPPSSGELQLNARSRSSLRRELRRSR